MQTKQLKLWVGAAREAMRHSIPHDDCMQQLKAIYDWHKEAKA